MITRVLLQSQQILTVYLKISNDPILHESGIPQGKSLKKLTTQSLSHSSLRVWRSRNFDVDDLLVLIGVPEFVASLRPEPHVVGIWFVTFFQPLFIEIIDKAGGRYPYEGGDYYHSTHDIVAQDEENFIDVDVFNDVPESFDYVLDGFFTNALQHEYFLVVVFTDL